MWVTESVTAVLLAVLQYKPAVINARYNFPWFSQGLQQFCFYHQIQMESPKSNKKFSFKCGRWLSKSEEDQEIIRELPAVGQGIEPLEGETPAEMFIKRWCCYKT